MEIEELIESKKYNDPEAVVECLQKVTKQLTEMRDSLLSGLIDIELFEEIKLLTEANKLSILFGKTLRDMKFIIRDNNLREHVMIVNYMRPKCLKIVSLNVPYTPLQEQEYASVDDILSTYTEHFNKLNNYFTELEHIDKAFYVAEPVKPTFKDDYRRILLDVRIWLHFVVTQEGLPINIHLIGHSEEWDEKLQAGLLVWDHDKDIVWNIRQIFGSMSDFLQKSTPEESCDINNVNEKEPIDMVKECCICLCDQLPDDQSIAQPLCQNTACEAYFHRNCLYQWLVAYGGGRSPTFGVAAGNCPSCLQPIVCSDKDN